jgi:biopolymer transport protein ExbD
MLNEDLAIPPRRKRIYINITSLIDVLFLLLIFFMVSSTFVKNSALKVSLPSVEGDVAPEPRKSISITVSRDRKIALNGSIVKRAELEERIRELVSELEEKNPATHFKVDRGVDYGFAVELMGALRAAGIETLMAVTDPGRGEENQPQIVAPNR